MNDLAPVFWKLSQGSNEFSFADMLSSIDEKLVYMNIKTGAKGGSGQTQAEHFVQAKIGDYFLFNSWQSRHIFAWAIHRFGKLFV